MELHRSWQHPTFSHIHSSVSALVLHCMGCMYWNVVFCCFDGRMNIEYQLQELRDEVIACIHVHVATG